MAYSFDIYTGDGSNRNFAIPFGYLAKAHVEVRFDGVLKAVTTDYTFLTASTIQTVLAPAGGVKVEVRRNTPKTTQFVNFVDASTLTETDLDNNALQTLYLMQEALDGFASAILEDATGVFDAESKRIKNVADPLNPQDAATKAFVDAKLVVAGNLPVITAPTAGKFVKSDGVTASWEVGGATTAATITDATAIGRNVLTAADAGAIRTLIDVSPVAHAHAASDITAGTFATARLGSGSPTMDTVLHGDQVWREPVERRGLRLLSALATPPLFR